jgi:hypothetical protein
VRARETGSVKIDEDAVRVVLGNSRPALERTGSVPALASRDLDDRVQVSNYYVAHDHGDEAARIRYAILADRVVQVK